MAAVSGSLFNLHEDRIEEVINKNIEVFLPGLDPIWRDLISTSQGVGPADALGRDLKILKVFMGSMAGVLEQGAPRGDLTLYGDDTDTHGSRLYTQSLNQVWPDPTEGPNAAPYRLGINMRSMMSNIMFTLGEMQAEATSAFWSLNTALAAVSRVQAIGISMPIDSAIRSSFSADFTCVSQTLSPAFD